MVWATFWAIFFRKLIRSPWRLRRTQTSEDTKSVAQLLGLPQTDFSKLAPKAWLPECIFSNQKFQFWYILEGINEKFWSINRYLAFLNLFGTLYCHLAICGHVGPML
jgi:hypothetical protein